jgi:ribosomal protein S27AE
MSAPTLDTRIATFQREMRRQIPWLLLVPATACFIMYRYTEYLRSPQATLDVWPIAGVLFGGAVVMSALLGRLVGRASARANLMCPNCGAPLGGYIKQIKTTSRCPKCGASLLESV